jgi:hypothetical protein
MDLAAKEKEAKMAEAAAAAEADGNGRGIGAYRGPVGSITKHYFVVRGSPHGAAQDQQHKQPVLVWLITAPRRPTSADTCGTFERSQKQAAC